MTRSYFLGSSSFPNRMLLRMVPGNTQGCCAAYVSWPLTSSTPLSEGSSPRMVLSSDDWTDVTARRGKKRWDFGKCTQAPWEDFSFQFSRCEMTRRVRRYPTFPAPTGPITANNWLDLSVRERFCRVGASRLYRGSKTNKQTLKHKFQPTIINCHLWK